MFSKSIVGLLAVCACATALAPLVAIADTAPAGASKPIYHLGATWKLAGEGNWDALTLDSGAHRLYVARGTRVQVLDSQTGALVGEVPGLSGAHGVALVPSLHQGFATSGKTNSVIAFDTQTLRPVGEPIEVGVKPDIVLFEPTTGHLFAFDAGNDEGGYAVSIIDPKTRKVVQTLALGANPEFAAADGKGSVWVNLESSSEVVQIDAASGKVLNHFALKPGEEPTGLALDVAHNRVFSACANKMMVVTDTKTGAQIGAVATGEGADGAEFDAKNNLAFSPNGRDGTLSVIGFQNGKPLVLDTVATHIGARTMTLDPQSGDVYVVAADYLPAEPVAPGAKAKRPKVRPGTVVVMKLVRN